MNKLLILLLLLVPLAGCASNNSTGPTRAQQDADNHRGMGD